MCSLLAPYLLGCLDEWFPEMKGCACQHTHTHTHAEQTDTSRAPLLPPSTAHRAQNNFFFSSTSLYPFQVWRHLFFFALHWHCSRTNQKKNNKGELKISCCWHPRNTEAHYPVARLTLMSHVQGQHDAILMVVTQHGDRGVDAAIAAPEAESRWINNGKMQVMSPGKKKKNAIVDVLENRFPSGVACHRVPVVTTTLQIAQGGRKNDGCLQTGQTDLQKK